MPARQVKLNLVPGGLGSTVEVDGQQLTGVQGISLESRIGALPTLELDLIVHDVEVGGQMVVTVPDHTRDALIALGWTPPDTET